jgi:hypothetical protein
MEEIERLIRKLDDGRETVFDMMDEIIQDDDGEQVGVRKIMIGSRQLQPEQPQYMPEPPLARALARSHTFHDVHTFASYLEQNGDESTLVLADVKRRCVTAVLSENDQEDRELVTLVAVEHPLWTPWGELLDRDIPVLEFALHCMRQRRAIVEPDARELALTFSQVKMSKAITVQSGTGAKSLNGVMVQVEIQGQKKDQLVELPESIVVNLPLFVGTEPQQITIDLLVTARGTDVVVNAVAADVEAQRIAAFEQFVGIIREKVDVTVGLGVVGQRAWNVAGTIVPGSVVR